MKTITPPFRWLSTLVVVLSITTANSTPVICQSKYSVIDLGTLGSSSYATAINDSGQVVGYSQQSTTLGFFWQNGIITNIGGLEHDRPSHAFGINNSGQVVGAAIVFLPDSVVKPRAVKWKSGVLTSLQQPQNASGTSALCINNNNVIVGFSAFFGQMPSGAATRWVNGSPSILAAPSVPQLLGYSAQRINDSGVIIGYAFTSTSEFFGVVWRNGNPDVIEIPVLSDINDSGIVIGNSSDANTGFVWRRGVGIMKTIPDFLPTALNNHGDIVGVSDGRAAIYKDTTVVDLNSLVDSASGWQLLRATDINDEGEIVGQGMHNGQTRAFLLKPMQVRRPVLLIPGIGATYPADVNDIGPWMFTRGIHPTGLQLDPLAHAYDDLLQTLKNVGYVEGKDLFVVNYDWRVPPGPSDNVFDGVVDGLSASSITDGVFEYAVDYLGYYLQQAMDAWEISYPGNPLDSVNLIVHSTGGLVARTYIQSSAYGGTFDGTKTLPVVDNLIMVGVPNRGASKAWNPLHDNWGVDIAFQLVLSKILNMGYQKVMAGATITGPDLDISLNSIMPPECDDLSEICFINQFNQTARSLLATYDFIDFGSGFTNVNNNSSVRNNLILDLNAGLDLVLNGDPNAFAEKASVTVIYATNVATPTAVAEKVGPEGGENAIVKFNDFSARDAQTDEVWYDDIVAPSSGDGTVPIESSSGQFIGDSRVNLKPFAKGSNTSDDVSHLGLMYNRDVQEEILTIVKASFESNDISTDHHSAIAPLFSTAVNVVGNIIGGSILRALLDPVEGFIVDGQGRRLGFSTETGAVTEIPGSLWFGNADGMGWVLEPLMQPVSLQLLGLDSTYYTMVSVLSDDGTGGLIDEGILAAGASRVLPLPITTTDVDHRKQFSNPDAYGLAQNFPNPFNPSTIIKYQLTGKSYVTLKVYNTLGQLVATLVDEIQEAGFKSQTWDATGFPSGIYYYRLQAGDFVEMKKLLLVK
ncbi:MAG: T9SS type A sorting domain-containing protein [Bacteroidetes bacterium]|nr:MAG: T9SS type A sorting domain-containing protein [Bacteroidota bacterium]